MITNIADPRNIYKGTEQKLKHPTIVGVEMCYLYLTRNNGGEGVNVNSYLKQVQIWINITPSGHTQVLHNENRILDQIWKCNARRLKLPIWAAVFLTRGDNYSTFINFILTSSLCPDIAHPSEFDGNLQDWSQDTQYRYILVHIILTVN